MGRILGKIQRDFFGENFGNIFYGDILLGKIGSQNLWGKTLGEKLVGKSFGGIICSETEENRAAVSQTGGNAAHFSPQASWGHSVCFCQCMFPPNQ